MSDERCRGCGVCCNETRGSPPFDEDTNEHAEVADEALKREAERHHEARADAKWDDHCPWLDPRTRLCAHYDERPKVCQEFEIGGEDCLEFRRCYGMGPLPDPAQVPADPPSEQDKGDGDKDSLGGG
jgi:Fe-S-cluster containining protein